MDTLKKSIATTQIHGKTKQEIADCRLDAGTPYALTDDEVNDPLGQGWVRINVDGYLYDVLKGDLR